MSAIMLSLEFLYFFFLSLLPYLHYGNKDISITIYYLYYNQELALRIVSPTF